MKVVPAFVSAIAVACVAASNLYFVASQEVYDAAGSALVMSQEVKMTPALRRQLQTNDSSTTDAITSNTPTDEASPTTVPPTTAPEPMTEAPSTSAPTDVPTTPAPTPTPAPAPTSTPPPPTTFPPSTSSTTTDSPATESPLTEAPTSTAPSGQTAQTPDASRAPPASTPSAPASTPSAPEQTNTMPELNLATPMIDTPSTNPSTPSTVPTTPTTPSDPSTTLPTGSATTSTSGSGSNVNTKASSKSSMSTGAVIAIVVGIVATVAVSATIIMCVIRRRREVDDDPLSPFGLSMDKSYNPTPNGYNAPNVYNPRAMGAANTSASGQAPNTQRASADTVADGLAYSQFYDPVITSPGSMNRSKSIENSAVGNTSNAATNLWLSAMEPKDNESYLSAQESPRSSRNSSRNSYEVTSSNELDMDVSSQISGHSNSMGEDFPDHNEDNDSARGSYEL